MNGIMSTAVFIFILLQLQPASTQTTYYIKSTPQSQCSYDDCLTLSEYASETTRYFSSGNLTLVFLPGEHTLNSSIVFQMFESLTLQGDLSTLPNITSKVACQRTSAFVLQSISMVEIKALSFNFCGNIHGSTVNIAAHESYSIYGSNSSSTLSYNLNTLLPMNAIPSVSVLFISNFHLISCHMEENHIPLLVNKSMIYIQDSQFLNNTGVYGGAIAAHDSTIVSVGHNQFVNNTAIENGGGIFVMNGELMFRGSATLISNAAEEQGGAIRATNSSVIFSGNLTDVPPDFNIMCNGIFLKNSAPYGGGISLKHSIMRVMGGNLNFTENFATVGGGVSSDLSHILMDGFITFESNAASYLSGKGGAVAMWKSTWNSTAISFVGNNARLGGAVYSYESHMNFNTSIPVFQENSILYNTFVKNTALHGGAIEVYNSTILFHGNNRFEQNSAIGNEAGEGGGIRAKYCKVSFKGLSEFIENSSRHNCEGNVTELHKCFYDMSIDTGRGVSIFVQNKAYYGGGILIEDSTLNHSGGVLHFTENVATADGGGIMSRRTFTYLDGFTMLENNSAKGYGGAAIITGKSTLQSSSVVALLYNRAYEGGAVYSRQSQLIFSALPHNVRTECVSSQEKCSFKVGIYFVANIAENGGGGLRASECIIEFNKLTSNFYRNSANSSGGGISASNSKIYFKGNNEDITEQTNIVAFNSEHTMSGNTAIFGGAISAEESELSFTGKSYFINNKAAYGGAIFLEGSYLMLNGNNSYDSNEAKFIGYGGYGGGIHAVRSKVAFSESHSFTNNSARYGGGLAIAQYDWNNFLYLAPTSTTAFSNNYAQKHGGAIHVEDAQFTYCGNTNSSTPGRSCFFSFRNTSKVTAILSLVKSLDMWYYDLLKCIGQILNFVSNLAEEGGNTIYGGALEKCRVQFRLQDPGSSSTSINFYASGLEAVTVIANIPMEELTRDHSSIASDALKVCICDSHKEKNCTQRTVHRITHPGATESFVLVTVGQANGKIPGVIHARFTEPQEAWLSPLQNTQNTNWECTSLKYTLLSNGTSFAKLDLYAEGPCGESGIPLSILVQFLPCPDGFGMSQNGSCECDKRVQKYTNSCNIDSKQLIRNGDFWVGFDNQSRDLILHPHCPFDYCKLEAVSFQLDSRDLQCAYGRSGTLCGACKSGLSLNLGSSQCSHCSNKFLSLLLAFATAGFLLVIFLFTCEVTIAAGTTSCLIFYANVIAVNRTVFFPSGETNIFTVFIAWLNLDLGIETCFFDGMDAYIRTWLQFMFPLYIWLLVGIITLVSYYSTTFARIIGSTNPISVLATLFLLSYTKLLRTIIATFSSTSLDYPNGKSITVWVYDGSIGFLEGKHIALFLAGLLVFLFLFLPYTLLLLFGQCIEARSNHRLLSWANSLKVKSFLDAYHAPYKNRHRYWTGLLLLLRFVLFIISAVININSPKDPSVNLLVLVIACAGLLTWTLNSGSMFKKWYNNVLESSFIFNLTVLAAASYQVRVEGGNQAAVVYTSVAVAFMTFLGIITFHVIVRVKSSRVWKNSVQPALQPLWESFTRQQHHQDPTERVVPPTPHQPQAVTTTFIDLREPLLESQD